MKLSSFDTKTASNAGVELQLSDIKTGKPAGVFITLLGSDSDEFLKAKDDRSRFMADRLASGVKEELTREERDELACDLLARCTTGWRNLDGEDGTPLPFSKAEAKRVYLTYPAIREQVNVFIADRSNFVQA